MLIFYCLMIGIIMYDDLLMLDKLCVINYLFFWFYFLCIINLINVYFFKYVIFKIVKIVKLWIEYYFKNLIFFI